MMINLRCGRFAADGKTFSTRRTNARNRERTRIDEVSPT